jgi:hypothetical protein
MLVTLLVALLIGNGCGRVFMNLSCTSFLANFSLEDLVKKNRSPSGQLCAGGGMGGIGLGGGGGGFWHRRSSCNKSSSFTCQIKPAGDNRFDEAAFLASLRADVENEISASGAKVIDQGSSGPAEFHFEYAEHDIRGRVEISGMKNGASFYTLEAKLVESREASRK